MTPRRKISEEVIAKTLVATRVRIAAGGTRAYPFNLGGEEPVWDLPLAPDRIARWM